MGRYLAPRGPDEETFLERNAFRVVFRRLAINDVAGGKQPFVVADGRFVAVVNGEIYNHVELARQYLSGVTLASRSDCEVVIHLFRRMGPRCLEKLNGIYSILIWDAAERALVLARDRLGVKPLYYSTVSGALVFASELKALLVHPEVPRDLDWSAFHDIPNPAFPYQRPAGRVVPTGIEGVSFVAPASYVEWREGQPARAQTYWSPPGPSDAPGDLDSAADYVDRYANLLDDAVRGQLMSDVPVGLFLSGGLDSSLIGAIASGSAGIEAFTLVEPSITRTGDPEAATRLARHLDMPLHLVRVDQDALRATVRLDLQALEYFVWSMDFPAFDVEFLFKHELHRHARCARNGMKVILLGQGADEFAGGYSRISGESWSAFTDGEARSFHASLLRQMGIPPAYSRLVQPRFVEAFSRARTETQEPWQYVRFGDLAAYNLWHEDRMASANGMEVRVPFLDHRLVELLCSIPRALRAELFFDKAIERRAALRFLPPELTRRPKVPLFQSGPGEESVSALRRSFVVGAFDDYREKYLESTRSLFSANELVALREQAAAPGGDAAVHLLCRCMALSIFERMCQELHQPSFEPPQLPATAPPLTVSSVPAPRTAALSPSSRVALSASVRLALDLDGAPALLVIEGGVLAAQIGLPPGWDLCRVPHRAFAAGQLDIGGLARAFGVDVSALRPLADAFVARGWGVLTDDGEEDERTEDRG